MAAIRITHRNRFLIFKHASFISCKYLYLAGVEPGNKIIQNCYWRYVHKGNVSEDTLNDI